MSHDSLFDSLYPLVSVMMREDFFQFQPLTAYHCFRIVSSSIMLPEVGGELHMHYLGNMCFIFTVLSLRHELQLFVYSNSQFRCCAKKSI